MFLTRYEIFKKVDLELKEDTTKNQKELVDAQKRELDLEELKDLFNL